MTIVTLSDALLGKGHGDAGTILRDRMLCGLCLRIGRRTRTFYVATSVGGKQVRVMLGRWPLISVDDARALALPILRKCRAGTYTVASPPAKVPTLREALAEYGRAKQVKASSLARYESVLRTHFGVWLDRSVTALNEPAFRSHCHQFAQMKGAALVDLGRGLIGSIVRYVSAVHGTHVDNPFLRLTEAGLLRARPQPRARKLKEADLPAWFAALEKLPERQADYLRLIFLTGLRKNECGAIKRRDVDLTTGILSIPDTKTGRPHTLPITGPMREILERRCEGLDEGRELFDDFSLDHVTEMAHRAGSAQFTLHDLRKTLATVGARIQIGDAILRRILNHAAKRSDVLNRHYVCLEVGDIADPLTTLQAALIGLTIAPTSIRRASEPAS